jgi:hypothetical protein
VRVSGIGKDVKFTPIVTSNKRSLMGIAMANGCMDICRYLVAEKGLTIATERDVTFDMLMNSLEAVLRMVPHSAVDRRERNGEQGDEAATEPTDVDHSASDAGPSADFADLVALQNAEMELRNEELCTFLFFMKYVAAFVRANLMCSLQLTCEYQASFAMTERLIAWPPHADIKSCAFDVLHFSKSVRCVLPVVHLFGSSKPKKREHQFMYSQS